MNQEKEIVRYAIIKLTIKQPTSLSEDYDMEDYINDITDEADYSFSSKDDNGNERIVDTEWMETLEEIP